MMKRFAIAALVVGALAMAANNEARAQGISIGFGSGYGGFGPSYGGFGPRYGGYGYGPGIGISVGPSLGYSRLGNGGYSGYSYRPSYGVGYGGYNGLNSGYSYGRVAPAYSVRRPAYSSYGRVSRGYCR